MSPKPPASSKPDKPKDEKEYKTCKDRGHKPSGVFSFDLGYQWERCRYCGGWYRITEPEFVEWPGTTSGS